MAKHSRRATRAADAIKPHLDTVQIVDTSVSETVITTTSATPPQSVNVSAEALAAATHRGDQIHGVEKLAKFDNDGHLAASMLRAGRDDKTQSVSAEDWYTNAALVLKNPIALIAKHGGVAFIRNNDGIIEIAAADVDGFGIQGIKLGKRVFLDEDGNLGIGANPAARLHVSSEEDQLILEDTKGNVTRIRTDVNGLSVISENGITSLSGKLVLIDPDGTITTLNEAGVVRESGTPGDANSYRKQGYQIRPNLMEMFVHSIVNKGTLRLSARRGAWTDTPDACIDITTHGNAVTIVPGVAIRAPALFVDTQNAYGDIPFRGRVSFDTLVAPSQPPTQPEDGNTWIASDGLYIHAGGVTQGPLGSGGGGAQLPAIPAPHVGIANSISGSVATGRDGYDIGCSRHVWVKLIGVPEQYFNPAFGLRVDLLRNVRARWMHKKAGIPGSAVKRATQMIHPVSVVDINDQVVPTEFVFSTLADGQKLEIPLVSFTRWFERAVYTNGTTGITTLAYRSRNKPNNTTNAFYLGRRHMTANDVRGYFQFRYSIINPVDGKRVFSDLSRMLVAHPFIPPTRPVAGTFQLEPNPKSDGNYSLQINFK